jgi:hypothetical protein
MKQSTPRYRTQIVDNALNHLDPDAVGFRGSEACEAALRDPALRNYLDAWVMPYLKALRDDDVPKWMRDAMRDVERYERRGAGSST